MMIKKCPQCGIEDVQWDCITACHLCLYPGWEVEE